MSVILPKKEEMEDAENSANSLSRALAKQMGTLDISQEFSLGQGQNTSKAASKSTGGGQQKSLD